MTDTPNNGSDNIPAVSEGTVVCPICKATFAAPGFDSSQVAAALARHIKANHADSPVPANDVTGEHGSDTTRTTTAADAADPSSSPATHPTAGDVTPDPRASEQGPHNPVTASSGPRHDTTDGLRESPGPVTPSVRAASDTRKASDVRSNADSWRDGDRCPRCGKSREQQVICPHCGSTSNAGRDKAPKDQSETGNPEKPKPAERLRDRLNTRRGVKDAASPARRESFAQGAPAHTKRAANALRDGKLPSVRDGVNAAIDKGAEALAGSAGVPPFVTRVLVKFVRKVLPYVIVTALLLMAVIFGGTIGEDAPEDTAWDVELSERLDIPQPYLDAYQDAARRYKLPWTLLAAVGAQATYHGRINPYLQTVPSPGGLPAGLRTGEMVLVGDSLSVGTEPYIGPLAQQNNVSYKSLAENGKRVKWGTEQLAANKPSWQATVVVALGTNDSSGPETFAKDVGALLNTLSITNSVWWVTIDREGYGPYNQVLREMQQWHPNLHIADWDQYVNDRGIVTVDGLHYDAAGYQERAKFIWSAATGSVVSSGVRNPSALTGPGVMPVSDESCPSLPTPVEGENLNQGAGPMMLVPSVLTAAGVEPTDIQNICDSADALAELLAETARLVAEDRGTSFPRGIAQLAQAAANGDTQATEEVHRFWAETVDRTGVLGTTDLRTCVVPEKGALDDQSYVGNAIDVYWRCVLGNTKLVSVSTVAIGTTVDYTLLEQSAATARAVDEALSVAWTWGRWGTEACDEEAEVAGVFPLDQATFDLYAGQYADKGRCDRQASITAAAAAYAAGEATPAATRAGNWWATAGGWVSMPTVTGAMQLPSLYATQGPWQPLSPSLACSQLLASELARVSQGATIFAGLTASTVQRYSAEGLPDELVADADLLLGSVIATASADQLCADERERQSEDWLGTIAGAYNGDFLSESGAGTRLPSPTTGNLNVSASTGDTALALASHARQTSDSKVTDAVAGETPLLARFSPYRLAVPSRPGVTRESSGSTLSLGSQIVNIAVGYLGGLFANENGMTVGGIGLLGPSVPYADIFNSVGQERGVDPRLLAAVARQESNFNPEAGCPTTGPAFGMMQKEPDMVPTICGSPQAQVELAADMLLARFEEAGDWRGALWGYNNGGVFSRKWRELGGSVEAAAGFAADFYCDGESPCRRGDIAMDYISDDPAVRSAYGGWLEYQMLFPASVISLSQLTVSGDSCPKAAVSRIPGRTLLRGGSDALGLYQLCVNSVAKAPSPEAAKAIIFAFSNIGTPYNRDLRNRQSDRQFDCSSLVSRSYQSVGVQMSTGPYFYSTHTLLSHSGFTRPEWVVPVAMWDMRPGDLIFPFEGHVAMVLDGGYMIHASATGDVVHVDAAYRAPLQVNRVVPALAPRVAPTS